MRKDIFFRLDIFCPKTQLAQIPNLYYKYTHRLPCQPIIQFSPNPIDTQHRSISLTSNCDSRTLYTLCTSQDLVKRQEGFRRLGGCLLPVARNQLNEEYFDLAIVQDCVQDALKIIWKQLKEAGGPQSPAAFFIYAVRITRHRCIDRYRYERRRITDALSDEDDNGIQHTSALGITQPPTPEQYLLSQEMLILLIQRIDSHSKLSDKAKRVLIEGFLYEKTDAELAQALSTTKANIRLIRHRALQILRADDEFLNTFRE